MVPVGHKLPEFSLPNQDGVVRTSDSFRGKWVVLFVYPKDDTPGCTIEARGFSATKADFDAAGAVAVGLSADDAASHRSFCDKHSLAIELLADPSATLLSALGVERNERGSFRRTTFLADPSGTVRKVYEKVDPNGHERAVLADIVAMT
jgi:thioredoxin-dependent peroxiredoxin